MEITMPFDERWEKAMLTGNKTCTSRSKRYGNLGDRFRAFGAAFTLIGVVRLPLGLIAMRFYKEEGCQSPEEFKKVWRELHPKKGFQDDWLVWLHKFDLDIPLRI